MKWRPLILGSTFVCLIICPFQTYGGQPEVKAKSPEVKRVFAGAAFAISFTSKGPYDPEGPAPVHGSYSESMPAQTIAATLIGGVHLGRHLGLGGELVTQRTRSVAFTQEEFGMTDYRRLDSRHTSKETIVAAVFRWHSEGSGRWFEPVGGLAVSRATDALTERHGTYSYPTFPPLKINAPDSSNSITRLGIVAGADAIFPVSGSALSVFGGGRLYSIDRSPADAYASDWNQFVPTAGGRVVLLMGGVRWQ